MAAFSARPTKLAGRFEARPATACRHFFAAHIAVAIVDKAPEPIPEGGVRTFGLAQPRQHLQLSGRCSRQGRALADPATGEVVEYGHGRTGTHKGDTSNGCRHFPHGRRIARLRIRSQGFDVGGADAVLAEPARQPLEFLLLFSAFHSCISVSRSFGAG